MKVNVVVDIEMCIVQKEYQWKDYPYEHEIIQIGAVMMDEEYEICGEFSSYVRPKYGRIDHFIQELTGISDRDILEAPNLEKALDNMLSWLAGHEVTFYSWSKTDYVQITREIQAKGIDEEKMEMFLDKERVKYLENVIENDLSSFEKQVLDLYMTGMSYTQIAKVLGRDEKSTDNALQRLKSKIKKML